MRAAKRREPMEALRNARATWAVNGEFRTPVERRTLKTRDESGGQSPGVCSERRRRDPRRKRRCRKRAARRRPSRMVIDVA